MTHLANSPPPAPPHSAGYDHSPVRTGAIFYFLIGFIITTAAILALLWWIQGTAARPQRQPQIPSQPRELSQPLQPSPGHPTLPWQDMEALRQAQEKELNTYSPSPDSLHTHIPIDRAIDLLLQSGQLQKPWTNPATQPYQVETQPAPRAKPSVENRT